jgi:hypothetical protein
MSEGDRIRDLLKDFEEKEEELKGVRAKYVGISPALSFDPKNVLSSEAVRELRDAEAEMHEAWLRFIDAAGGVSEQRA